MTEQMPFASLWSVPLLLLLGLIVSMGARRRARARNALTQGRIGRTSFSRFAEPLRGDLDLIAQIGESHGVRHSASTRVLRTTIGLRAISVGLSGLFIYAMLSGIFAPQGLNPGDTPMVWLISAALAIGVFEILTYELQYDRHGMILTRFMYWRRSYEWAHLLGIDDDQHYQYVLAFSKGGRVKVLKHLVGMPDFLTQVGKSLDQNETRHAGTARG